jgi:hypothetical protein
MTKIEINEDCVIFKAEPRILLGVIAYVALQIKAGAKLDTAVSINLTAEEAEALGCQLLSAATAIYGRPPLDISTALDGHSSRACARCEGRRRGKAIC